MTVPVSGAVRSSTWGRDRRRDLAVISSVLVAAFVVRAVAVLPTDFPLNDGGLFLAMTLELELNGWSLPAEVAWNGRQIPFAYPPLGFYLTGLLAASADVDILSMMKALPLVFSAVTAGLVTVIGRTVLASRPGAWAAGATYAFAPSAFTWAIAGGGITRAPGMALAMTTIWLVLRLLHRPTLMRGSVVGIAAGATVLTHPASAVFGAGSALLFVMAAGVAGRLPAGFGRGVLTAMSVGLAITLPWAVSVVAYHGPGIFAQVASNGPDVAPAMVSLLSGRVTGLGTDPLGLTIVAAALVAVLRRKVLLPIWLVGASLLGLQYAIVPGALLVGSLVSDGIRLARANDAHRRMVGRVLAGVISVLLLLEAGAGITAPSVEASHLHPISADRRSAMAWVAGNTSEASRFVVLTGDHWSTDPDSEWFYVLAERPSIATVQGQEWLGRDAYRWAADRYAELQRCTMYVACLEPWLEDADADYVFIPKGSRHGPASPADCCSGIRNGLINDESYRVVYDGEGATIVRVGDHSTSPEPP